MDDQGLDPQSAPPATADPAQRPADGGSPLDTPTSQPPSPWRIPQPAPLQAPAPYGGQPPDAPLPAGAEPSAPMPPYGGSPSTPLTPAAPGAAPMSPSPGAPSTPLGPGGATPAYPMYPAYPAYPTYPGSPSMPLPANEPGPAGSPTPYAPLPSGAYPGAPGTLPPGTSYPEAAATPYYPVVPAPAPYPGPYPTYPYAPYPPDSALTALGAARRPWLAQPFAPGLTALIAAGALVLLVAAFLAGALVGGQDWAGSAFVAGFVAVMLALGAIALFVLRIVLGRRSGSAIALGVVGIVLLVAISLGGLAGAAPIRALQASTLESGGSWSAAIHEYALSGEHAPNAPDIARVYDEWGESLLQQKSFAPAVVRFNTVITTYASSGAAAVNRANLGLLHTYGAWVVAGTSDVPYATAIAFFGAFATNSACDDACHAQANAFEAQGRFQYGQQLASQGFYQGAVAQFEAIQSQFPTSPYAPQAHGAAAKAYLALGQQQISGQNCATDAVSTYQTLAKSYADTPEGKQAQAALKAPVTVTGNLTGSYPRNPTPQAVLSRQINANTGYFSSDYVTSVDAANGGFTFHNVNQGKYNFSTNAQGLITYWVDNVTNDPYIVQVGPLCTVQLGGFNYS